MSNGKSAFGWFALVLGVGVASVLHAATWTVYHEDHVPVKDGADVAGAGVMTPVQQLTNALAQATTGSTVIIKPGVYDLAAELMAENLKDSQGKSYLTIPNKFLSLQGEDATHWAQKSKEQETVLMGGPDGRIIYGYAGSGRSSVFKNLTFEGGTAESGKQGGAIYFMGTEFIIPYEKGFASNCVFRGNSATHGGATYAINVYDSLFTNNLARGGGGAAWGRSANANYKITNDFVSCVFIGNVSQGSPSGGGALYLEHAGHVEGCSFEDNKTTAIHGGAVYVATAGGSSTISNCTFSGNSAAGNGGAVYGMARIPVIDDCLFLTNRATQTGGGLFISADQDMVGNCRFEGNAANSAGAFYCEGTVETMTNCTFIGNTVTGNAASMSVAGYGRIVACTFRNNFATRYYAGVYHRAAEVGGTVENCLFDNNTNMFANAGSQVRYARNVVGCTFSGYGDMFAQNYDRCLFDGCRFDYEGYGGGLIVFDKDTGPGHLRNCLFQNNTIHIGIKNATGAAVEIANCSFVSNSIIRAPLYGTGDMFDGYMIYAFRNDNLKVDGKSTQSTNVVVNCAFANNLRHGSRNDVNFYATSNGTIGPACNVLSNSFYETASFDYKPAIQGNNVSGVAPKFLMGDSKYPGMPPYMPRRGSALRNAGQLLPWMTADATDLVLGPRVVDGLPDIGCYECDLPMTGTMLIMR